ncbi:hypothetical protein DH2020_014663 [Rehmannia glutinosa]|uniref:Protein TIFY n=1 Tax=Rehmannia glutinosa TaxID=99300 RepID=A0ABR0WYJ4_REHGL
MDSSEKIDSGRFSGGRSNFSQTCSLLSQYLKEKGSFGELSLGLTPNLSESPKGTMNLLPMIGKSGPDSGGEETLNRSEKETGQMTIFYAGQVLVFDDFPADKANEIMTLASKSSAAPKPQPAAFAPPHTAAESATSTPNIVPAFGVPSERARRPPQPALASDLPIARKNSLARFLEKRKDRITANAPYQLTKPAAAAEPKPVKTEPWLGLASQFPLQIQRH